jgi:hypothetical protein
MYSTIIMHSILYSFGLGLVLARVWVCTWPNYLGLANELIIILIISFVNFFLILC